MAYEEDYYHDESYREGYQNAVRMITQFEFGAKDVKRYESDESYRRGFDKGEEDAKQR